MNSVENYPKMPNYISVKAIQAILFAFFFITVFSLGVFGAGPNPPEAVISDVSSVPTRSDQIFIGCEDGLDNDCVGRVWYYYSAGACSVSKGAYSNYIDDSNPADGIGGFITATCSETGEKLCVWVEDSDGQTDISAPASLNIDCINPTCLITSPTSASPFIGMTNGDTNINFTITEANPAGFSLSVFNLCGTTDEAISTGGVFPRNCAWTNAEPINYDILLSVSDKAGNTGGCQRPAAIQVRDNTPPVIQNFEVQLFKDSSGVQNAFSLNDMFLDAQNDELDFQITDNQCSPAVVDSVNFESDEYIDIGGANASTDTSCLVFVRATETGTTQGYSVTGSFLIKILTYGYLEANVRHIEIPPTPQGPFVPADTEQSALIVPTTPGNLEEMEVEIINGLNPKWATKPADIYFLIDASGSFQQEIGYLKSNIGLIYTNLTNLYDEGNPCKADLEQPDCIRFGVAFFSGNVDWDLDGNPTEPGEGGNMRYVNGTVISKLDTGNCVDNPANCTSGGLTNDVDKVQNTMQYIVQGGGREPWLEYVNNKINQANWRSTATKVIILITDSHSNHEFHDPEYPLSLDDYVHPSFPCDEDNPVPDGVFCVPPKYYHHYTPQDFENVQGLIDVKSLAQSNNILISGLYAFDPEIDPSSSNPGGCDLTHQPQYTPPSAGGNRIFFERPFDAFVQEYGKCPVAVQLPFLCDATNGVCENYTDPDTFAEKIKLIFTNIAPDTIEIKPLQGYPGYPGFESDIPDPANVYSIVLNRGETPQTGTLKLKYTSSAAYTNFGYNASPQGVEVFGNPNITNNFYFDLSTGAGEEDRLVASIVGSGPYYEGSDVYFSAIGSSCLGVENITNYIHWTFYKNNCAGTGFQTKNGKLTVSNKFPDGRIGKTYRVKVELLCPSNNWPALEFQVPVANAPPRPVIGAETYTTGEDIPVNFSASAGDPGICDTPAGGWHYDWDFGDGKTESDINPTSHSWNIVGTYSLKASTFDKDGAAGISQKLIQVNRQLDAFDLNAQTVFDFQNCDQNETVFADQNMIVCFTLRNLTNQFASTIIDANIVNAVTGENILPTAIVPPVPKAYTIAPRNTPGETIDGNWHIILSGLPQGSYAVRLSAKPPAEENILSNNSRQLFFTKINNRTTSQSTGVPEIPPVLAVVVAVLVLGILQKKKN